MKRAIPLLILIGSLAILLLSSSFVIESSPISSSISSQQNIRSINEKNKNLLSDALLQLRNLEFSTDHDSYSSKAELASLAFTGFIQNLGQLSDDSIYYYYRGKNLAMSFGSSIIKFTTLSDPGAAPIHFSLHFPGSNVVLPEARKKMDHMTNYLYGDFQLTNVPSYTEIWYYNLYPGTDLRYYMSPQGMKYDFIVHPGADPSHISLQVSESMILSIEDQAVSFQSCTKPGQVLQDTSLQVYQADGSNIPSKFISKKLHANTYGFQVASYDPNQILIIDPLWLAFSSFLGGNDTDVSYCLATDSMENFYLAGYTRSNDTSFPIHPPMSVYDNSHNGESDIFVAKFNYNCKIIFTTFIGGSESDIARGIGVDDAENVYVTGYTGSNNFPVINAFDSTYNGGTDTFVLKLTPFGTTLLFSTFLGGSDGEDAWGIAVDINGSSYITGFTKSNYYPVSIGCYQNIRSGDYDSFVTKLDTNGGLVFSTFLGGSSIELGIGIAVDTSGNSYVTGQTASGDFPTFNAYDSTYSGVEDVYITKLNAAGTDLVFSTFFGGSDWEYSRDLELDAAGNIYIIGTTISSDFPMENAFNSTYGGQLDAFVSKFNATCTGLIFSTYFGGSGQEYGLNMDVDVHGNSYITGFTNSTNLPLQDAYQNTYGGGINDAYAAELNATGNGLVFSSYFGGNDSEWGSDIKLDDNENIYLIGRTRSSNFPLTANAFQRFYRGEEDAYMMKFTIDIIAPLISLVSPINGSTHLSGTLISLNFTDDKSGIHHALYNWDGASNTTLTPLHNITLPVGDGQHILHVYANDSSGNWASAIYVFTSDDTLKSSDFFTAEIFLLASACLLVFVWRKRKKHA